MFPVSGTYISGRHSVDFNYRSSVNVDANLNIYIDSTAIIRDLNIGKTAYCRDLDSNSATVNQCYFINGVISTVDLNVDWNRYSDGNHAITIDLNSSSTDSNRFTSSGFVTDNRVV
ncbi:MAG: hypothetical protein HY917_02455 [Candidatus Diapherotrites archaeon]|nr:hypothetical protein [Candidatus Diapherotrites archaeon]